MCSTGAHIALNSIDHNLKVVEKLGVSYHNTRSLHQKVDSMPDRAGDWITRKLSFKDSPNEEFTIRYRDPIKAIQSIWEDPSNADHLVYAPKKVFSDASKTNRIFNEMWTGKWWHGIQVRS